MFFLSPIKIEELLRYSVACLYKSEPCFAENQPCTGLCYYNKLVGLNTKENNLLTSPISVNTTVTQRTLLGRQRESGDAPCVGLCYHYKKMGEERAFRNIEVRFTYINWCMLIKFCSNEEVFFNFQPPESWPSQIGWAHAERKSAPERRFGSAVCRALLLSQKTWTTLSINGTQIKSFHIAIDIACSSVENIISSTIKLSLAQTKSTLKCWNQRAYFSTWTVPTYFLKLIWLWKFRGKIEGRLEIKRGTSCKRIFLSITALLDVCVNMILVVIFYVKSNGHNTIFISNW